MGQLTNRAECLSKVHAGMQYRQSIPLMTSVRNAVESRDAVCAKGIIMVPQDNAWKAGDLETKMQ